MKIIAFVEPPQGEVIEMILRHCDLWHPLAPRASPAGDGGIRDPNGNLDSKTMSSDKPAWRPTRVTLVYVADFG